MMETEEDKDLELITRYFDFDLSDPELSVFEKRIDNDSEFEKKVKTYQESIELVNKPYKTNDELLRIKKWKSLTSKDSKRINKQSFLKWAGGIAATFLLSFFLWQSSFLKSQQSDFNTLLKASWNKKIGLDYETMRSGEKDSLKEFIILAYKNFNKNNYEKAIKKLQSFNSSTLYYEDALLIRGLSEYKKGNIKSALSNLDSLAKHTTQKKAKVALWYKGLIYLEMGDIVSAKQFLELPNDSISRIKEIKLIE